VHTEEYDKAVLQHKWAYKLSRESGAPTPNARLGAPIITPAAFLGHLVVAGDQVNPDAQSIQDGS